MQRADVHGARRRALDDEVGLGDELVDRALAQRAHHGALGRVEKAEQGPVVVTELCSRRRPRAHRVTVVGLDLDHVGAGVGEQLGAVGTRDLGGQVDDPQASGQGSYARP